MVAASEPCFFGFYKWWRICLVALAFLQVWCVGGGCSGGELSSVGILGKKNGLEWWKKKNGRNIGENVGCGDFLDFKKGQKVGI